MDLFNVGQKISLFFTKGDTLIEMACVIEVIEDDRLVLILPQYFMRYIDYLQVGSELTAKVFSKFGTVDFNTIVISSPLEDEFSIELDYNAVKLTKAEDMEPIEAVEKINIKSNHGEFKLKTIALSGEVVRFTSETPFNIDEVIDCTVTLPDDYGIISFKAIISEIDEVYENEYTATYTMMTENDRQNLLYYIYMYGTGSYGY